jgi:hypothetical protein
MLWRGRILGFLSIRDFISYVAEVLGWFVTGTGLTSDLKAGAWSPVWLLELSPLRRLPHLYADRFRDLTGSFSHCHWRLCTLSWSLSDLFAKKILLMLGATTLEASHSLSSIRRIVLVSCTSSRQVQPSKWCKGQTNPRNSTRSDSVLLNPDMTQITTFSHSSCCCCSQALQLYYTIRWFRIHLLNRFCDRHLACLLYFNPSKP